MRIEISWIGSAHCMMRRSNPRAATAERKPPHVMDFVSFRVLRGPSLAHSSKRCEQPCTCQGYLGRIFSKVVPPAGTASLKPLYSNPQPATRTGFVKQLNCHAFQPFWRSAPSGLLRLQRRSGTKQAPRYVLDMYDIDFAPRRQPAFRIFQKNQAKNARRAAV